MSNKTSLPGTIRLCIGRFTLGLSFLEAIFYFLIWQHKRAVVMQSRIVLTSQHANPTYSHDRMRMLDVSVLSRPLPRSRQFSFTAVRKNGWRATSAPIFSPVCLLTQPSSHTPCVSTPVECNGHQDDPQHTHRVSRLNRGRLRLGPGPFRLRGLGQPFLSTKLVFSLRDGVFFRGRATGDEASAANNSRCPGGGRAVQLLPCQRCPHFDGESPTLGHQRAPI